MNMEEINKRIKREVCYNTLSELRDENLLPIYKQCKSLHNQVEILENVLDKYIDEEKKNKIIEDYIVKLIPAGTKGVIRGNIFNSIVKRYITNLSLDTERFEVCFEQNCETHITSEKPDWYILEKSTNKIIIGMNQLDLWGGGHQTNRGTKYIGNDNKHNNENSKLLCVICNDITFKSIKNKTYKLFEIGFERNTLCYLNNLQNIINSYFNLTMG